MTRVAADVIIVGGGPAGSACARALVQAGLHVVVVDRATFPRDKTCAGWITPEVVSLLDLDPDDYRRTRICQTITGFRTGRMGAQLRETRFGRPVSYGICRAEFDDYLLKRSGAALVEGTPVTRLERTGDLWVVNGTLTARVLVGAGGHLCPVARHLGARPADETSIAAQEVEFRLTPSQAAACRVAPETPELSLCRDLKGYGWCFRKGDRLNVGLGRLDPLHLPQHVHAFHAALVASGTIPPDTPRTWKGHSYLLRDLSPREPVADGVLLTGDAAGLAATISGEGIRPAIESGQAAARTILAAAGRYDRDRLASYGAWLEARLPRGRHAGLDTLPRSLVTGTVSGLLRTSWFTRRVLLERWFLQAA